VSPALDSFKDDLMDLTERSRCEISRSAREQVPAERARLDLLT